METGMIPTNTLIDCMYGVEKRNLLMYKSSS